MEESFEGAGTAWGHRDFRFLLSARVADAAGNAIAPIAIAFAIIDLGGSATEIGSVVGVSAASMVLFVLFGGVVADRWSRSTVLVWSNVVSGVVQAVIAVLVLTGEATVGVLVGLSFLSGGAGGLSFPASFALISETVPESLLQNANATSSAAVNTVRLAGTSSTNDQRHPLTQRS